MEKCLKPVAGARIVGRSAKRRGGGRLGRALSEYLGQDKMSLKIKHEFKPGLSQPVEVEGPYHPTPVMPILKAWPKEEASAQKWPHCLTCVQTCVGWSNGTFTRECTKGVTKKPF